MRQKTGAGGTRDSSPRYVRAAALSITISLASPFALAAPSGGEVTAGNGSISQSGGAVTIDQSSSRLAINWQRFEIGTDESVTFNQPSAQAIALNRILGQDPSVILGRLSANGQVFLLNPNGVLFGGGAQVDVGGIVASTLSLSNEDFLVGRYTFAGSDAGSAVVNRGAIDAAAGGYVAFIGPSVVNEGVIRAGGGTVALGAGDQVTLNVEGDRLVGFSVDKAALGALAANRQLIEADGGTVILSAQAKDALLSSVVNNDGIIEARSVSSVNGVIQLDGGGSGVVSVAGTLDASGTGPGEVGGQITVTGEKVALLDGARVDASGSSGGGTVLVGGGYQGSDPDVRNAARTFVGTSAEIRADALESGDGGRVIVWADGDTRFRGAITATGGAAGDGGFVEVSGKQQLGFDGRVDTSAVNGAAGTLLLDPNDLYIAAAPVGGALPDASNPFQSIDGVNDYYVLGTTLTALPANTAVQLQANRDIIFQANLAMPTTAAGSLTFDAANSIRMGGFNLSTANAGVSMSAGAGGISNLGTINLGTGTLSLDSAGAITQNAGDIIQGAGALVTLGAGTFTLTGANTYTGATIINAGTLRLGSPNRIANASAVTVAAGATFDLNNRAETVGSIAGAGNITLGTATLTAGGNGSTTAFAGTVSGTGRLTKTGVGALTLSGANTYSGVTTVSGGTLRAAGGSAIADASQVTLTNTAGVSLDLTGDEAIGNLSGGGGNGGNITLNGNTLTVNEVGNTTFAGIASGTGGLIKQGAGSLRLSRANTYSGVTAVNAGTLALGTNNVLSNASRVVVDGGVLSMTTRRDTVAGVQLLSGSITGTSGVLTSTTAFDLQSGTVSAGLAGAVALNKSTGGTVLLSHANTYSGATNIDAGTLVAASSTALGTTAAGTIVANGGQLQIAGVNVGVEAVALNGVGASGAGSLIGTGNAALAGAVTLASASSVGAPNAGDSLTLSGAVNGAHALTQTGAGTVVFAGAVGGTTALASFASASLGTTAVNGGLLRTTGTQVYDGALITGVATTLSTASAAITANASVTAPGTLTLATGSGDVSMPNPLNNFSAVAVTSAGSVDLVDASGLTLGASAVASLRAQTLTGDITLAGVLTATGSGDAIVLASGGNFFDNAGASALSAPSGRWLVWSADPAAGDRGGLVSAFKQYDATFGVTPIAGAGNGFLYSIAPFVTPTLVGSVTRVYDATTDATLLASNYAVAGTIDGDTVTLNNPVSGTFDDRNAGAGKNVGVAGLAIASASNGPTTVYGYRLASNTANASIGTITPAALTLTASTNTKTYDGTTTAAALPTVTGLMGGDTVSGLSAAYDDRDVGTGKTLSVASYTVNDGNGGNNYTVGLIDNLTGVIDPAALLGSIAASDKVYDATNAATIALRTLSGVIVGDSVSYVGGVAAFSDKNAGVGKTVTATGLGLGGADAGNYVVNTTAMTTADITALGITGAVTASDKMYDGNTTASIASRTLTGVLGGDDVSYVGGSAQFADRNAGSGKSVSATGLGLAGADAANYTVNATATAPADITPATLTYIATPVSIVVNTPFPTFAGNVAGFVGTDTQASATSGTLLFATAAPDSSRIGAYAVDGSGLSANFGNYLFVQDARNATALLITPRAVPGPEDGFDGLLGAVASALQAQGDCVVLLRDEGRVPCDAQTDGRARHAAGNAAFARDGAGIQLPSGVSVQ
jgi:filamentous hemagglutinin family protein